MKRDWLFVASPPEASLPRVLEAAARATGRTKAEITSHRRFATLLQIRDAAIRVAYEGGGSPLWKIGRVFNRDHSSLHYSLRRSESCEIRKALAGRIQAELTHA